MKKFLITLAIILLIFSCKTEINEIYEESIRFRIIPNSNSIEDIFIKEKVLQNIQKQIHDLGNYNEIKKSRKSIKNNLDTIKNTVEKTLALNNYNKPFTVNYGLNYFPEKEFDNIKYKEGYYESLVVELGDAKGDNFWCVMFPPFCFMEVKKTEDIEYKFKLVELINKLFGYKK